MSPNNETAVGVGLVGAGPAAMAVHLPTLGRLQDELRVRVVMDIDERAARQAAGHTSARATTDLDDLLEDPAVDVVAICTPDRFHADQVVRALRAGKAAVLCEKPLALSEEEVDAIEATCRETGVPLIVGTMHLFDPAWKQIAADAPPAKVTLIRSNIVLPLNDRFESRASEGLQPPTGGGTPGELDTEGRAELMRAAVLGLAVHDLPLVRRLMPAAMSVEVCAARVIEPFGYSVTLAAGGQRALLYGQIHGHWEPRWELEAVGERTHLQIEFPPSFVHSGSGTGLRTGETGSWLAELSTMNGYEAEWRELARLARNEPESPGATIDALDDARFSVRVADAAARLLLEVR